MSIETVWCPILAGELGISGPLVRYGLLERLHKAAKSRDVLVLAFGVGSSDIRLVLEGADADIRNTIRGMKVGTTRAAKSWGVDLVWDDTERTPVTNLEDAVVWAHRAPIDAGAPSPLSSPWSSHRDLLCFRKARFYDVAAVEGRVDPRAVHERIGGRPLPEGWPPSGVERESLDLLLRLAASVQGVLPANRRCFRLFVHLAQARGWSTRAISDALQLTRRRIRQLAAADEPLAELGLVALSDPRLCRVP